MSHNKVEVLMYLSQPGIVGGAPRNCIPDKRAAHLSGGDERSIAVEKVDWSSVIPSKPLFLR